MSEHFPLSDGLTRKGQDAFEPTGEPTVLDQQPASEAPSPSLRALAKSLPASKRNLAKTSKVTAAQGTKAVMDLPNEQV